MKYFLPLLIVALIATGLLFLNGDERSDEEQRNNEPVTGLPWQIDRLPDGNTRVFGITLGQTTLDETIELLGDDMKLAIIAAPHENGTVEAYYSHHSAGPITGKMILVLDIPPDMLSSLRERASQDGGTRRYRLHPDDLPTAYRAPIKFVNFLPSFNLDEDIVQARFGTPAEILRIGEQQHWLYPDKGLDLILDANGKELLQYLRPADFGAHRTSLQQLTPAGE